MAIFAVVTSLANRKFKFLFPKNDGEKMLEFIPKLEVNLACGMKVTGGDIPQYKSYTSLILLLTKLHQGMGVKLKGPLLSLKKNLILDLNFEKKLGQINLGVKFQFLAVTMVTWGFILFSSYLIELEISIKTAFFIGIMQILGIIFFGFFKRWIYKKKFLKFDLLIERFYLFHAEIEAGMSVSEVLLDSKIQDKALFGHREFNEIENRLHAAVERWKKNGISPKSEAFELIESLWEKKEFKFTEYLKNLEALKFVSLALFFLPAYFLYLHSIFVTFMEQ